MSEEFDSSIEPRFSSFIPLTILLAGFIIWFGYQDYELNKERSNLNQNLQTAIPTISEAEQISQRYVALMKDLVKTAQTDDAAKAIVNDAIKNGLIRVQPNATNGTNTPAAPPADSGTK